MKKGFSISAVLLTTVLYCNLLTAQQPDYKFIPATDKIEQATRSLPRQVYTADAEETAQLQRLYKDCLFDKIWEPALPGLPHRFFSITGIKDGAYAKCQLLWDPMFIVNAWAPLDDDELIRDVFQNYWFALDHNPQAPKGSFKYGFIPCTIKHFFPRDGFSQSPILAWGCMMVYNQTRDYSLLELSKPYLDAFLTWFATERDVDQDGLIEYGAYHKVALKGRDMVQTARFETFDQHATLDHLKLTRHPVRKDTVGWYGDIEGVEATAFLGLSERAMIEICRITGDREMMKKYEKRLDFRTKALQTKMWNEEKGFFYSVNRDTGEMIDVKTIQGFIPLVAGMATAHQAAALVRHLKNPKEFWCDYPVPTSAMDEPTFDKNGFWRGDMWPQTTYLVALGLNRYGYYDIADELARRMDRLVKKLDGHAYERYNGVDGTGIGILDYCWGLCAWSIAVNTLYGIQEDYSTIVVPEGAAGKKLKLGKLQVGYPDNHSVELQSGFEREFHVTFRGRTGKIRVECDGKTVKTRMQGNTASFLAAPGKTYRASL